MTPQDQPLVGWRLWRLRDDRLRSWVVDNAWRRGPNEARCIQSYWPGVLVPPRPVHPRCGRSPGTDCGCGLWALRDFGSCVAKARAEAVRWQHGPVVLGLMAGWGTVAIHGDEGFRAQHASVICLFSDPIGDPAPAQAHRVSGWWAGLARRMSPERAATSRLGSLRRTASHYGVPLLSLADAVRLGALGEFGVSESRVSDVEARLAELGGRPR